MIGKEVEMMFGDRLGKIPEMTGAVELVRQHPEVANNALEAIRQLVRVVAELSPDDWKLVEQMNVAYGRETGENPFIRKLGKENLTALVDFVNGHFGESEECAGAVDRLCQLMENAHQKKTNDPNWKPTDGDPESDRVIWGQTVVTNNEAKVHLAVGHFVSQLIFQKFRPVDGSEWGKDDFLSLTDVVALLAIKYTAYLPNELLGMVYTWYLEKPDDLGWISEKRDKATSQIWDQVRGKIKQ